MRRSADHFLHAIKDGIRNVRYTIRAEVEAPGAVLPKTVARFDMAPLIAVGSVVGTPALRAVDGLLTQVESLATEVIRPLGKTPPAFPAPIDAYFSSDIAFSDLLYDVYKRLLQAQGAGNVLLSEHALDRAQEQFQARHGDRARGTQAALSCAGLALALAETRPIRKVDFHGGAARSPRVMLAPNIYCAAVVGLMTALVTRDPMLRIDAEALRDSVDSVVNARFDRFKQAMAGKSPVADLASQFEAILPFLP